MQQHQQLSSIQGNLSSSRLRSAHHPDITHYQGKGDAYAGVQNCFNGVQTGERVEGELSPMG